MADPSLALRSTRPGPIAVRRSADLNDARFPAATGPRDCVIAHTDNAQSPRDVLPPWRASKTLPWCPHVNCKQHRIFYDEVRALCLRALRCGDEESGLRGRPGPIP